MKGHVIQPGWVFWQNNVVKIIHRFIDRGYTLIAFGNGQPTIGTKINLASTIIKA